MENPTLIQQEPPAARHVGLQLVQLQGHQLEGVDLARRALLTSGGDVVRDRGLRLGDGFGEKMDVLVSALDRVERQPRRLVHPPSLPPAR
jgi:hypothetical protein